MRYKGSSTDPYPDMLELSDVATWIRADEGFEIEIAIKAAMGWAESFCNQPLFERTYTVELSDFYASGKLVGVNAALTGVSYDTASDLGLALTLDTDFRFRAGSFLFVRDAVAGLAPTSVTLSYSAGWKAENLPANVKMALLVLVGYFYDNRANPVWEKWTVAEALLQPYKLESV